MSLQKFRPFACRPGEEDDRRLSRAPLSRSHRGFTLLELLVVIAIIVLMVAVGVRALHPSADGALRQASATLGGIFQYARTEGIMRGVQTSVLIYNDPADPEKHLRFVVPAYLDPADNTTWRALDKGTYLPANVFFDKPNSSLLSASQPEEFTWASGLGNATASAGWYRYRFSANGAMPFAEAQLVLSVGRLVPGQAQPVLDPNRVAGFWMNRFGSQSYFDSNEGIIH